MPSRHIIKTKDQITGIRKACEINTMILDKVSHFVQEEVSTEEINHMVHKFTLESGGIPAPLDYNGFPKSVCTSVNDVVCHGIPSETQILKSGDIINVDVTTVVDGYYGDASRMYCIGEVSQDARKLVEAAKESLNKGLTQVKPWGHLGDIGAVISEHCYSKGYTVVKEIGGHGVGNDFHEEPWVSHIGKRGTDMLLVPGMIFTIEPMVNMGGAGVFLDEEDGWTIYTEDGSLSAQWEYTVLVTENGSELLSH